MRGQNIYSVLQMDRWIFHYIWKIYKSTRNCQWIGGFFWLMLLGKSTNLQEIALIYNQLPETPSIRGEKSYSVLQMDRWIFEHIWKIYKSTRNCQWIGRFLGFGCYWENLQIYKESRYTYSQLLLTASRRWKNIYSVLHMDRWIFELKNLQIYKELPMDRKIFWFWMIMRKSTILQWIALYL